MKSNVIAIIPARFGSTRFPGKPLVDIGGKTMIQRVYEQTLKAIDRVWVATDDRRIYNHVKTFGKCLMTSTYHHSGTDRCNEAAAILGNQVNFSHIVNVQGDEPFIDPDQIEELVSNLNLEVEIATQMRKVAKDVDVHNPNLVKVVADNSGKALYFSRAAIPFLRETEDYTYYCHVGIYAYRKDILKSISNLPVGRLESAEKLEQLRWLSAGYTIQVFETEFTSSGIDSPEDLRKHN